MKSFKQYSLLIILLFSAFLIYPNFAKNSNTKNYVQVYYFHGKYRCQSCFTIEKFIKEAVNQYFSNELKSKKVKLKVIDYDIKGNEKYIDKFNLFNQSLIIVKYKNGKIAKFKDCPKIWELFNDQDKFFQYVKKEVDEYLKQL